LEAHGTNVGRKAKNWEAVVGPIHPHCFKAGTQIQTQRGLIAIEKMLPGNMVLTHKGRYQPVTQVWASWYKGNMIVLSGNGFETVTTPNHQLRLGHGDWCRSDLLQSGNNLLGLNDKVKSFLLVDINSQDTPAPRGQNSSFALVRFYLSGAGVPIATVNLNGELFIWERDINQATPGIGENGVSGNGTKSPREKFIINSQIIGRYEFTGSASDMPMSLSDGVLHTAYRGVSVGSYGLSLRRAHSGETNVLSFTISSRGQSQLANSISNSRPGKFHKEGYTLYRETLAKVIMEQNSINFGPVHLASPLKSDLDLWVSQAIGNVNSILFEGWVYNLSVDGDESYVANGIVSHNCECKLQRVPNGWGFNEEGYLAPGGEFGIEYDSREDLEEALKAENDLMKSVKEGHVDYQGLPITIENAPGTKRHWQDENGKTGSTTMLFAYGYLDDTDAMDGDELDVYIGPDPKAETVYIVHQQNPHTGIYDEEKCFLGFNDERTAKQAYRYHFDTPEDYLLTVTPMALDGFKRWAHSSTKQKDNPDVRLVIPLDMKKAELGSTGRESTEFVETMADARAPGPGVGANYVFPVPQRGPMVTVGINELAPREMLEQAIPRGNAVKRDRHVYDFTEPLHQEPHKIEIPEQFLDLTMLDPKEEERRKQLIIKLGKRNIRHPANKVDVETEDDINEDVFYPGNGNQV
jgi:hypothetical protein